MEPQKQGNSPSHKEATPASAPHPGVAGPPTGAPAGPFGGSPVGPPANMSGAPAQGAPAGPPPGVPAGPSPGPDPTTGALNMPGFGQQYAKAIMSHAYEQLALWYIDIRNFRSVNPKYGFMRGNVVLQQLVANIRELLTHDLPVARLGADRFVALTAGFDYDEACARFERLIEKTEQEIAEQGIPHQLVLTAGIYYLRPEDYNNPSFQRSLDYVSIAHRNARTAPQSMLALFTDEDLERDTRRITIEQTIDEALENGQIEVWYQPQIDYIYGEVIGAEALSRWHHPELGWISPSEFIPILENCGKVHKLDLYVWEEACRNAGRWRAMSDGVPVPISVNVSRVEMYEPGLMEHFLELRQKYDLPKGSLHLEVTESAFVEESSRLYDVIESMRAHDMMVEMDDFGSGLSSINMLKDVPVDVVKLDMGFMQSAMSEDRGGVVLGSVIRMLQGLDTPIIAEGVETLEQAEMLKNMGCHLMQGYHFSRPMALDDFESFIASNRAVENAEHRERTNSHLDELTSIDATSSYLFNHAMGGTLFFFAGVGTSESILVNDQFYRECGLSRLDFGNAKINPIKEISPSSRDTLWRAAAEARERGAALCRAEVERTGRWIEGVIRYLGTSSRGDVYSLNIVHSEDIETQDSSVTQIAQDMAWDINMLDKIVPNAFIKCDTSDSLSFNYVSPMISKSSGLSESEFIRRFHNSLVEAVLPEDRTELLEAVREARVTGKSFAIDLKVHHGYGEDQREIRLIGRVEADEDENTWLYALVLLAGDVISGDGVAHNAENNRIITFDYELDTDKLTIQVPANGVMGGTFEFEHWLTLLQSMPENISKASAAKILATVRDLRHHPAAGFTDIKCNLRGSDEGLRWYHVNYTCDADENGMATVLHGYAQDANDQMGSARWWRAQAETDQLTGLLNRNAAEQGINLAMRTQGAGMMFMIDLDGFKRVNDELGHLTGDALLRDVAEALASKFRESDVLGRYGGDEFVAFMPVMGGNPHTLAAKRSQAVIDAISAIEVGDGTHAACSVGVAISRNRDATFYDLLEVADEALYASKEAGKSCYTIQVAE